MYAFAQHTLKNSDGDVIAGNTTLQITPSLFLSVHVDMDASERMRVERFLEDIYAEKYGATLKQHYPVLMSAQDADGTILAAIGFRFTDEQEPFLAHYLDESVEQAVSQSFGKTVKRQQIVEIGSLAANGHGPLLLLFVILAGYLHQHGRDYAVVTGTKTLQSLFRRIGLNPQILASADQTRLSDGGRSWGTYYDTDPKVLAGDIAGCYAKLQRFFKAEVSLDTSQLFASVHPRLKRVSS